MRTLIQGLAKVVVALSFLYGEFCALRAFFQVQLCHGSDCRWILAGWHPVAVGALFLLVYLPLTPVVTTLYAWPGYLLGALLFWIAGWGERARPR